MRVFLPIIVALTLTIGLSSPAFALPNSPYTTFDPLNEGFTQEVFGTHNGFLGGVAFAPDGDVYTDACAFSGSPLFRHDLQSTFVLFGTTLHTELPSQPSNAGCGLANHPNGFLYSNTASGITKLDVNTGAQIGAAIGSPGNALGIAVDPVSGDIFYVSSTNNIRRVTTGGVDSAFATVGGFIDGIFFNGDGSFLYIAQRNPFGPNGGPIGVWEINPAGTITQKIATNEPDGLAFHAASGDIFVNQINGQISRIDLDQNPPAVTQFASGGFRGDLAQVGADGCAYLTQNGVRYDDGTVSGLNSIVRICGGFIPPPGVDPCEMDPTLPQCNPLVGGTLIPIDSTALLIAGVQSTTWMFPVVLSVLGIGLFVVSRKSK